MSIGKNNPSSRYTVGYGKPPKAHQFKKGRSGNPAGRPVGSKNLKIDLMEELSELMRIREGGKHRRVTKQRALIKTMVARGLGGNDRAAAKVIDLYLRVSGIDLEAAEAGVPLTNEERDVMEVLERRLQARLEQRTKPGASEPVPGTDPKIDRGESR